MAVQIDVSAFRGSIPADVLAAAERVVRDGGMEDLETVGGGARAVVADREVRFQPWVGVVNRVLVGACDCADRSAENGFCTHAVAVALAAFEANVRLSSVGLPHGVDPNQPEVAGFLRAVRRLGPRQLTDLVVEQANRDRLFATLLLSRAGMLDATSEPALADFRTAVREASNATTGSRWGISDVEEAGRVLVTAAQILCAHPPTVAMVDLMEQAIEVWDELAGYLIDAYDVRRVDPEEISEPLIESYRELCARLDLSPDEIADRIDQLLERCDNVAVDWAG